MILQLSAQNQSSSQPRAAGYGDLSSCSHAHSRKLPGVAGFCWLTPNDLLSDPPPPYTRRLCVWVPALSDLHIRKFVGWLCRDRPPTSGRARTGCSSDVGLTSGIYPGPCSLTAFMCAQACPQTRTGMSTTHFHTHARRLALARRHALVQNRCT